MEELISKKKLVADLNGIREVLSGQGDPILASVLTRAIQCVERQPTALMGIDFAVPVTSERTRELTPIDPAIERLKLEYIRAERMAHIRNPVAYALYQTWKYMDERRGK